MEIYIFLFGMFTVNYKIVYAKYNLSIKNWKLFKLIIILGSDLF